jgi:hypothetical protein
MACFIGLDRLLAQRESILVPASLVEHSNRLNASVRITSFSGSLVPCERLLDLTKLLQHLSGLPERRLVTRISASLQQEMTSSVWPASLSIQIACRMASGSPPLAASSYQESASWMRPAFWSIRAACDRVGGSRRTMSFTRVTPG